MKTRGVKKLKYNLPLIFTEEKRLSFRWIFGSSHLLMGFLASLGVHAGAVYFSNFFIPKLLAFLFFYLIIHLVLALDYYYDRNIDEKFLLFFYSFSIIVFLFFSIRTFIGF